MRDPSSMIQKFEGQGYKFKSNSFNGQKYQADNSQNEFEVHFMHGTQNVSRTDKVTETVKYQFADGRRAQEDHVQTAEFTQHGVQDLVTKTTDWVPSDPQTFVSVDTPHITGYTADVQNVPAATVNFGDADITRVVTYKANDQLAGIKYIDDTTGKTIDTEAASGKFGTKIEFMHDPSSMIQKFEGQGYKLVSDNFNGQKYQADNSKNQFEVHFKHGMKNVSRTSTITRTVNYVHQKTGKEIHQPVIQTLTFTENGVTDLVTGKTTWDTPSDQQFVKVESPKIDGYENPDILVVDAETVKFGDGDQTVTVHYQKVEIPATSDNSKAPNNSSTPSAPTTQNESNISTMPIHTPTQVGLQNVNGQQISNNHGGSQLPQTGNQDSHQAGLVGLVSVIFAGLLGLGKLRKKND